MLDTLGYTNSLQASLGVPNRASLRQLEKLAKSETARNAGNLKEMSENRSELHWFLPHYHENISSVLWTRVLNLPQLRGSGISSHERSKTRACDFRRKNRNIGQTISKYEIKIGLPPRSILNLLFIVRLEFHSFFKTAGSESETGKSAMTLSIQWGSSCSKDSILFRTRNRVIVVMRGYCCALAL